MSEIVCEIKDRIIQALRIRNMNAKQFTSSIYAHLYDNKMQEIQSIFNKLE